MSTVTILLCILAVVLALTGIAGAVLPALPGPPISWLGLLVLYFALPGSVSTIMLLVMLFVTIVVTVLDYVAPAMLTKVCGGSKLATWGSTIGTIVGLFFMPWGLLIGPFVGAFLGELIQSKQAGQSLKVAAASFASFLLTTGIKLFACLWMTIEIIISIFF